MNEIVKVFEGKEIMFKMVEGEVYCSATSMAKAFPSKNLSTWINSKGTEEYLTELCAENGRTKDFYIDVNKGGTEQGTWIHESLVSDLQKFLINKNTEPTKLYVFESMGFYKIGITSNITDRLNSLQTGNPFKISINNYFNVKHPYKIEKHLHKKYLDKMSIGEWFLLDQIDLDYICEYCSLKAI